MNKGSEKQFQEVSEAYEVLSDDGKRKQYDMFGMSGGGGDSSYGSAAGGRGFEGYTGSMDPEELFRTIFSQFAGGAGGGARRQGGSESIFGDFGNFATQQQVSCESTSTTT